MHGDEFFLWAVDKTGKQGQIKRVNATVLIKPFNLKALDSTIRDVLRKLV